MRFADIVGRDGVKQLLASQADTGRLPHALLLWGEPGEGKLALARALAQYIHCPNRADGDSCGVCPVCRQHAKLNYPDLLFSYPIPTSKRERTALSEDFADSWREFLMEHPLAPWRQWLELCGAENSQPIIRVDESGDIIRRLSLNNYSGPVKVLILWLPEKLNSAAANKLLKLVEEPQPGRMFIMVSNSPALILPTIFSRLQRVKVDAPTVAETAAWLTSVTDTDAATATQVAQAARGNQLLALQMLDPKGEEHDFRRLFQDVMRRAWKRDVKGLRSWADEVAALKREKSRRFLAYFVRQLRLNYLYELQNLELTPMLEQDRQFSERFSPFVNGANVEEMMKQADRAARDIAGNANARIVLFDLALYLIMEIKKTPQ